VDIRDPATGDGSLGRELAEKYGIRPLQLGLTGLDRFYFHMLLEYDGRTMQVPTPQTIDQAGFRKAVEAGIKRFGGGLLHTVALYAPQQVSAMGIPRDAYTRLTERLGQNVAIRQTDLKTGQALAEADLLLVLDPKDFDDKQRFAVDQFLMRGGSVIVAASPFDVVLSGQLGATPRATGLEDWLKGVGAELQPQLVMDPVNTPFPVPVRRQVGGYVIEEVRQLPYPFFADLREERMAAEGMTAGLGQLTLTWPSPLVVDAPEAVTATPLLWSSAGSGVLDTPEVQPDFRRYPESGFPPVAEPASRTLAVLLEGRFDSAFAGKRSPLRGDGTTAQGEEATPLVSPVIDRSPASARLLVIGSGSLLSDAALQLLDEATRTRYEQPLQLIENAIDWSLEDRGLLTLRGRGQYSRMLSPMDSDEQQYWEGLNYVLALAGLGLVAVWRTLARRRRRAAQAALLAGDEA
jgi:ABC-2 type transport system permease protein